MEPRFTRLMALLGALAVALIVTACRCGPCPPCEDVSGIPTPCGVTFQRLVVTNKHTKPIVVAAVGKDDSNPMHPVDVPFKPLASAIAAGGTASLVLNVPGTNVDRIVVTYLADDHGNSSAYEETLAVGSAAVEVRRCVNAYNSSNNAYDITELCK